MGTSIRWQAAARAVAPLARAPLTWLIVGGFVLMAATAIGTALTVERFRQSAIDSGRESLESAVQLLARHFCSRVRGFLGAAEEHHRGNGRPRYRIPRCVPR